MCAHTRKHTHSQTNSGRRLNNNYCCVIVVVFFTALFIDHVREEFGWVSKPWRSVGLGSYWNNQVLLQLLLLLIITIIIIIICQLQRVLSSCGCRARIILHIYILWVTDCTNMHVHEVAPPHSPHCEIFFGQIVNSIPEFLNHQRSQEIKNK